MTINELKHQKLKAWIGEVAAMTTPDSIVVCDGSKAEYDKLIKAMVDEGLATPLNPAKKPGCYSFRSDPSDVARVENRTYIASKVKEAAGPTNNWIDPAEL